MASSPEATQTGHSAAGDRIQKRHTIAAVVYFLYGLFYLFGAQYLTGMRQASQGMSGSAWFFVIGAVIAILFPVLIYMRFTLAFSLWRKAHMHRSTLHFSFTLMLGLLVIARVIALIRGDLYLKTPIHTAGLIIAAINAACLLWAGLSRPAWIVRDAQASI